MAAPIGHLTIKFNSIKFNSLGLLCTEDQNLINMLKKFEQFIIIGHCVEPMV